MRNPILLGAAGATAALITLTVGASVAHAQDTPTPEVEAALCASASIEVIGDREDGRVRAAADATATAIAAVQDDGSTVVDLDALAAVEARIDDLEAFIADQDSDTIRDQYSDYLATYGSLRDALVEQDGALAAQRVADDLQADVAAFVGDRAFAAVKDDVCTTTEDDTATDTGTDTADSATSSNVLYETCAEARNADAAPLNRNDLGYRLALDTDNDGVACERATDDALPVGGAATGA